MSTERPPKPDKPTPQPRVTREDLERFGDEDQMQQAWDEARLRDEAPPHHQG